MRNHHARIHLVGQKRFDLHIACGFTQLKLHIWACVAEVPQNSRQDAVVGRTNEGQRQRAHLPAREPLRQRRERVRLGEHAPHLDQPARTHRRERHRALRAVEQRDAQLLLQRTDLLRQRRLRHRQALGSAAEMQLLGNGHEIAKLAQIHIGD